MLILGRLPGRRPALTDRRNARGVQLLLDSRSTNGEPVHTNARVLCQHAGAFIVRRPSQKSKDIESRMNRGFTIPVMFPHSCTSTSGVAGLSVTHWPLTKNAV